MIHKTLHIFENNSQAKEFMRNRDPKEEHAAGLGTSLVGIGCERIKLHCEFSLKDVEYITNAVITRLVP